MGKGASPMKGTSLTIKDKPMKAAPKATANKDKPSKKPAAAPASMVRRLEAHEDLEKLSTEGRDKGKSIKYNKMKSTNSLPPWCVELVEQQTKSASSPRAEKSKLINRMFRRLPDGALELALDNPEFVQAEKVTWLPTGHSQCSVLVR